MKRYLVLHRKPYYDDSYGCIMEYAGYVEAKDIEEAKVKFGEDTSGYYEDFIGEYGDDAWETKFKIEEF